MSSNGNELSKSVSSNHVATTAPSTPSKRSYPPTSTPQLAEDATPRQATPHAQDAGDTSGTGVRRSHRKPNRPAYLSEEFTTPQKSERPKHVADTTDLDLDTFQTTDFALFNRAHSMVAKLVKARKSPYRKKLESLAQHSIDNFDGKQDLKAADVVPQAWNSVVYCWTDPSTDVNMKGGACAYTSMGEEEEDNMRNFPVIAISSVFQGNDYRSGQRSDASTALDNQTLLFFFRKIKHEFLHVVHRFLAITHNKHFDPVCTPPQYTPHKQDSRNSAVPEVGDHDEEEDSGGPILPLSNKEKLSTTNPLCLYFENKYLKLSEEHVLGLLRLNYSMKVEEGPHNTCLFSVTNCRAWKKGVLDQKFFDHASISKGVSKASSRRRSRKRSRARSPAARILRDDDADSDSDSDSSNSQPAWRRLPHIPMRFDFSRLPPSNQAYLRKHAVIGDI